MDPIDTVLKPGQSEALDKVINAGHGPMWIRAAFNFMAIAITSVIGGPASFLTGIGAGLFATATATNSD
jgi:hypothetical protein